MNEPEKTKSNKIELDLNKKPDLFTQTSYRDYEATILNGELPPKIHSLFESIIRNNKQGLEIAHSEKIEDAVLYEKESNIPKALEVYSDLIKLGYTDIYVYKISLHLRHNNNVDAMKDIEAYLKLQPDNKWALYHQAIFYDKMGNLSKALKTYSHLIELGEHNCYFYKIFLNFRYNHNAEAMKDIDAYLKLKPNDAWALYLKTNLPAVYKNNTSLNTCPSAFFYADQAYKRQSADTQSSMLSDGNTAIGLIAGSGTAAGIISSMTSSLSFWFIAVGAGALLTAGIATYSVLKLVDYCSRAAPDGINIPEDNQRRPAQGHGAINPAARSSHGRLINAYEYEI